MNFSTITFLGMPSVPELLLILAVIVLLFGAAKLPELARSSGQALRIFKKETKGLLDSDEPGEKVVESNVGESKDSQKS